MRLEVEDDTVAVETGAEDKELAAALGGVIGNARDLLDAVRKGECEWCDGRGQLRPYQVTQEGEFTVLDVCPDCQAEFVNDAREAWEHDRDALSGDVEGDDDGE